MAERLILPEDVKLLHEVQNDLNKVTTDADIFYKDSRDATRLARY